MRVLVYGYGNPGRQDDGLGIQLAEELGEWAESLMPGTVVADSNYQLNIEDAETMSDYDVVIFADASKEETVEEFCISAVKPSPEASFTTHSASAEYLLHLCGELFNRVPETFMVHMKGYEWDFREGLTEGARSNLRKALAFLKGIFPSLAEGETTNLTQKKC